MVNVAREFIKLWLGHFMASGSRALADIISKGGEQHRWR